MLKLFTLPGEGKIRSPSPFAWKTEAMQTCAAPSYLAIHGVPEMLSDLDEHQIVHYVSGSQHKVLPWQFRKKSGETERFKSPKAMQVNDSNALLFAALSGLGIVQMPELMIRSYLEKEKLVPVLTALQPTARHSVNLSPNAWPYLLNGL